MGVTYFKRYRMVTPLANPRLTKCVLPAGYELLPWHMSLMEVHAEVKYLSFHGELDSCVFPCLGDQGGCRRLMQEISQKPGFLPEATWLLTYRAPYSGRVENCGTVQGIVDQDGYGGIQNLGIIPQHRNLGLGTRLLVQALSGFRQSGLQNAYLEVTAQNSGAVKLYRRMGFKKTKTVYKAVEVAYS